MKLIQRPRRLRINSILRESLSDVPLEAKKLIVPVFLVHGEGIKEEVKSLPGVYHFSIDMAIKELENYLTLGLTKILIFGIPKSKDAIGTSASDPNEIVQIGVKEIKNHFGNKFLVITDVCLCAYTDHGHCGVLGKNNQIMNDKSIEILSNVALSHVVAGADIVAPSDMMDGRIGAIRKKLDENGYEDIPIISYAIKFASSYYGPFREAADSSPQFGDRKGYQLSYENARVALREIRLDEDEGTDAIMVKPALAYLDIIYQTRKMTLLPVVAYNVSGEYSMVKFAGQAGAIDENQIAVENLKSILRAGADLIITYHAVTLAEKGLLL
ncbi:MAG: porphobilinogen synthase [Candidatus Thorarchaeota archaeon]